MMTSDAIARAFRQWLDGDDAASLITATLLAAFTPHQGG